MTQRLVMAYVNLVNHPLSSLCTLPWDVAIWTDLGYYKVCANLRPPPYNSKILPVYSRRKTHTRGKDDQIPRRTKTMTALGVCLNPTKTVLTRCVT